MVDRIYVACRSVFYSAGLVRNRNLFINLAVLLNLFLSLALWSSANVTDFFRATIPLLLDSTSSAPPSPSTPAQSRAGGRLGATAGLDQSFIDNGRGMTATGMTHVAARMTPCPCRSCALTTFQDRLSVPLMAEMTGKPMDEMSAAPGTADSSGGALSGPG